MFCFGGDRTMRRLSAFMPVAAALLSVAAVLLPQSPAFAQDPAQARVALVIGNGAYRSVPTLANPANDATDIAGSLVRLGFHVRQVRDASFDDMRKALLDFNRRARVAEVAILYFAGHGIEVGGENWLIPIDAELRTDIDVDHEAIGLRSVLPSVESASKLGLVILDACRNNPFSGKMQRTVRTRSVSRGLAQIEPSGNVLVAYAAKDGTTAADGEGRNSPFTGSLLRHLETPGLEINFLFRNVRDDVIKATRREQQPFVYGSLSRDAIYLKAGPATAQPSGPSADELTWAFLKDTQEQGAIRRFIERFPQSALRKEAERRLSALAAAEARKKGGAPAASGPSAEDVAWALIRDSRDPDQLRLFLLQFPNSVRRATAEERVAVLQRERADTRAPPPPLAGPSAEDIAWNLVSESKDPDQFRRFIEQFPEGVHRREAADRIERLVAAKAVFEQDRVRFEAEQAKGNAPAPLDRREIARYLQFELKRVGCFDGAITGQYTEPTRTALRNFSRLASLRLPDKEASLEALKAVREVDRRVCPVTCRTGERPDGERCVRITCPSDQVLRNGACVARPEPPARRAAGQQARPRAQTSVPLAGANSGRCFSFNGRQFCE